MFEHHRKTIDNLKTAFEGNSDYIAFVVNGSVARGDAGEGSDVDYYLVIDDDAFRALLEKNAIGHEANEHCVPPCQEANGFLTSKAFLNEIQDRGSEIARWSFHGAQVIFSRDSDIAELAKQIPRYPEGERRGKMESYYSQMFYHMSFFEFAYYSKTKYLMYETATKMIHAAGRLILADNRMLYPNRKRFFAELQKVPDKPAGLCDAMLAFLDNPTVEAVWAVVHMVQNHKPYPVPPEGVKERIVKDSVLNWYYNTYCIEDW
jgi:hypothetical protein